MPRILRLTGGDGGTRFGAIQVAADCGEEPSDEDCRVSGESVFDPDDELAANGRACISVHASETKGNSWLHSASEEMYALGLYMLG